MWSYADWNSIKHYIIGKLPFILNEQGHEELASFILEGALEDYPLLSEQCKENGINAQILEKE